MKLAVLFLLAGSAGALVGVARCEDTARIPLEKLAPRPPNPAPSEQPKDGLNPMLGQKRLPHAGSKRRRPPVRVRGAATSGYGAGSATTKVGEF